MTARERRRLILAQALRRAEPTIAGTYRAANRQEWEASRRADGWSARIVRDAIGAGSLERVRAAMLNGATEAGELLPERLARATRALAIIDTQRLLTTRRGHDLIPHRSTAVPPRMRSTA